MKAEALDRPYNLMLWKFTISTAILEGEWKLIRILDRLPMLFHLPSDPSEQHDLAMEKPQITRRLLRRMGLWQVGLPHPLFLELKGKNYQLASNNGSNHLHGGNKGFESRIWEVNEYARQTLRLTYISPHLEEGYPGELSVLVTYTLTDDNALEIRYHAITDRTTVINLTHHSYFNLKGEGEKDITSRCIKIFADRYTPINKDQYTTPRRFHSSHIFQVGWEDKFLQGLSLRIHLQVGSQRGKALPKVGFRT